MSLPKWGALISLVFLLASCRLTPLEDVSWKTDILTPIAFAETGIFDVLEDTSNVQVGDDNLINLVLRDTVASARLVDFVEFPDTVADYTVNLDALNLTTDTISQSITLADVARQLQADGNPIGGLILLNQGNTLPLVPATPGLTSGLIPIDGSAFFQFAELDSGELVLTIENEFPLDLSNVIFRVANVSMPDDPLVLDTFQLIEAGTAQTRTYDLAGKTVESQLEGELVNLDIEGGIGVPIDTMDFIRISLIAQNLQAKSATAVFPQQTILDTIQQTTYVFPREFRDVELTKVVVASGKIEARSLSTVEDTILFSYSLPGALNAGGEVPEVAIKLNPAPPGGFIEQTEAAELAGFTLDLRGDGSLANTVAQRVKVDLLESGNLVTLGRDDSVSVEFGLVELEPVYVEGYIGKDEFRFEGQEAIDLFDGLNLEKLRLAQATADITFENSIGVDAQLEVRSFTASNRETAEAVKLTGAPLIAGPATIPGPDLPDTFGVVTSGLLFETENSNVVDFINVLADEIVYDIRVLTNFNGVPGVYDNFATNQSSLAAFLDFTIPMEGTLTGLVLTDSTEIEAVTTLDIDNISQGTLRLVLENQFPVQVRVSAQLWDGNGNLLTNLAEGAIIEAGIPRADGYVDEPGLAAIEQSWSLEELQDYLDRGRLLTFSYRVDTQPDDTDVKIFADYTIKAKLVGQFDYTIEN
ncbi:MAG: hypothetical protein AAFV07_10440 [Bacteroidota bacterium]